MYDRAGTHLREYSPDRPDQLALDCEPEAPGDGSRHARTHARRRLADLDRPFPGRASRRRDVSRDRAPGPPETPAYARAQSRDQEAFEKASSGEDSSGILLAPQRP